MDGMGSQIQEEAGLPEDIKFPLDTVEQLDHIEKLLEDKSVQSRVLAHFTTVGGEDVKSCTHRLLRYIFSHHVSLKYNWKGKGDKLKFEGKTLAKLVEKAVRKNQPGTTASTVEGYIKDWLRYAKDREGGRKRRAEFRLQRALQQQMVPEECHEEQD